MRIVLFLLGGLVAVILLVLVVGMFLPGDYDVERTVTMNAKPDVILHYVSDLRQWPNWTPWNEDNIPGLKSTFSEDDPSTGTPTTWTWEDPSMRGMLVVTRSDNTGIAYDITFEGFPPAQGSLTLKPEGEGTVRVTWRMTGSVGGNPISHVMAAFISMDEALGAELDDALTTLKGKVEG